MGMNAGARLKSEGLNVSKSDLLNASVHDIFFPPKEGHVLSPVWHPRGDLTIDDPGIKRLVDEIVRDGGINKPILVREDSIRDGEDGISGAKIKVLTIVDGAGRIVAGRLAEPILQKAGKCLKGLRVDFELFDKPGNLALLLARQRADSDPSKRPHSVSVLAVMVQQMVREKATTAQILEVMPRWVTERDVEGFTRFHLLSPDARDMFDRGEAAPNLFRAVLDEPAAEQSAVLKVLVEKGVTHMKGASLVKNREARAVERKAASSDLPKPGDRPVQKDRRPHPKTMRKVVEGADKLGTAAAKQFALGIRYALGEDVTKELSGSVLGVVMNVEGDK